MLYNTEPIIFNTPPRFTPVNINVVSPAEPSLPEQTNIRPPIRPKMTRPTKPGQTRTRKKNREISITANEISRNMDPVFISKQKVEVPKVSIPLANEINGQLQDRKALLPPPLLAGKPSANAPNSHRTSLERNSENKPNSGHLNIDTTNQDQSRISGQIQSALQLEEEHNRQCPFQIHFSNLPDIFMSQYDFDQQYLLPALQAQFLEVPCRTKGMELYLDWLSYFRSLLFTV